MVERKNPNPKKEVAKYAFTGKPEKPECPFNVPGYLKTNVQFIKSLKS